MGFIKEFDLLWDIMLTPGKAAKKVHTLGEALKLYYIISVIPFILYLVFGLALSAYVGVAAFNYLPIISAPGLTSTLSIAVVSSAILLFFILVPIGIAIDAFIFQLVGRFFLNAWKGQYPKTFTAVTFSVLPVVFFYWFLLLPGLNALYIIVVPIWAMVLLVISLASQQGITRLNSALVVFITTAIKLLFVFLVATSVFAFLGSIVATLAGIYSPALPFGVSTCGHVPFTYPCVTGSIPGNTP